MSTAPHVTENASLSSKLGDAVLEERVAQLEKSGEWPPDLTKGDWALVVVSCLVVPIICLIIAWTI